MAEISQNSNILPPEFERIHAKCENTIVVYRLIASHLNLRSQTNIWGNDSEIQKYVGIPNFSHVKLF